MDCANGRFRQPRLSRHDGAVLYRRCDRDGQRERHLGGIRRPILRVALAGSAAHRHLPRQDQHELAANPRHGTFLHQRAGGRPGSVKRRVRPVWTRCRRALEHQRDVGTHPQRCNRLRRMRDQRGTRCRRSHGGRGSGSGLRDPAAGREPVDLLPGSVRPVGNAIGASAGVAATLGPPPGWTRRGRSRRRTRPGTARRWRCVPAAPSSRTWPSACRRGWPACR